MAWKPETLKRLNSHYQANSTICQLSRMYIRADMRRRGIGANLEGRAAEKATELDYKNIYLHADMRASGTLDYWYARGYSKLSQNIEMKIIDFNKKLHS